MTRLTTDTPKDNLENALNLFYVLEHETWVRRYGPPPECPDISLDDLMRSLIAKFLPEVECPKNPGNFSCMMAEWLYDDVDTMEGTLALLYSAAWAFAELRERLKAYEDTGLTPEQIRDAWDAKHPEAVTKSGWISVEDWLPPGMADVLVIAFWHERWQTMIGWCRKAEEEWRVYTSHGEVRPGGVTHWMPLPEPQKEDSPHDE